jgi:hypothetical protein
MGQSHSKLTELKLRMFIMKTQNKNTAIIEPQSFKRQNETMNHEPEQFDAHDLDFMDRMFDAANDMGTDDWGDCLA